MKLYVVFAQRRCSYEGEYAPEPIAVCSDIDYDENPDYIEGELEKAQNDPEFVSAAIIHISLSQVAMNAIDDRLTGTTTVKGDVSSP